MHAKLKLGWTLGGAAGAVALAAHFRSEHVYLVEAVEIARKSLDPEIAAVSVFPKAKTFQDFAYGETKITGGRRLWVEARKIFGASETVAEDQTWKFYWDNPWEVKSAVIRNFHRIKYTVMDVLFPGRDTGNFKWEISRLFVEDSDKTRKFLVGDPLPEIKYINPKSEFSILRWKIISASLLFAVAAFCGRKFYRTRNVRYSFADSFVRGNALIAKTLGPDCEIVSRKGIFGQKIIDGVLELKGKTEAVVNLKAAKVGRHWKLLKAEIVDSQTRRVLSSFCSFWELSLISVA